MQFAIIENGIVVNVVVAEEPIAENWIRSNDAEIGDLYESGKIVKQNQHELSPLQVKQQIIAVVTARLNEFAKTRNYDSILSACTYATSTNTQFASEGQYCVTARDNTWAKLYQIMDEVEAGTRPMPSSYADIESELPVLDWANIV